MKVIQSEETATVEFLVLLMVMSLTDFQSHLTAEACWRYSIEKSNLCEALGSLSFFCDEEGYKCEKSVEPPHYDASTVICGLVIQKGMLEPANVYLNIPGSATEVAGCGKACNRIRVQQRVSGVATHETSQRQQNRLRKTYRSRCKRMTSHC